MWLYGRAQKKLEELTITIKIIISDIGIIIIVSGSSIIITVNTMERSGSLNKGEGGGS